ncbi:MAG: hypothetical protein ACYC7A_02940 [Thermoanaerobaculia bacterium]
MKSLSIALALSVMLLGGACSDKETNTATNTPANAPVEQTAEATDAQLTPEQLGELGAEIEKNPNEAKQLISEKGLNEQQYEQAMRKLAEDPAASKRYAEAYQKARG